MKKAVAKSGESLMGRELFVDSAANKPKRDNSFGGGERTPRQPGEYGFLTEFLSEPGSGRHYNQLVWKSAGFPATVDCVSGGSTC